MAEPRILAFAEQDAVGEDDVRAFWEREGAFDDPADAERRVRELHVVAVDAAGELAAVSTAYVAHDEQLRMPMWYFRLFVGAAHRRSRLGLDMAVAGRDVLEERFVTGRDTRAAGVVYELENAAIQSAPESAWQELLDFTFVGRRGAAHVRVHYFPGATAPPPPA